MKDKIVFDIETKNTFADVGGQDNIKDLLASVVGVYSYNKDEYTSFEESEFPALGEIFKNAGMLIGFASKRFDVPVMEKYFNFKLSAIPHYDILEEIEDVLGRRIGLGILAETNLGIGKSSHGLEAVEMYKRGEIQKLKDYCVQDVRVTKEIFDLIKTQNYLWIPQRNLPEMIKLPLSFIEKEDKQESLF